MSFEALYEKYQNGTATPEEVAYVEEEIAKARKMSEIMENYQTPQIEEASVEVVHKAKKKFTIKSAIRTAIIALVVLVVGAGAVLGGVFGTAASAAADKQIVSREGAEEIAMRCVVNNYPDVGNLRVRDVDKDLEIRGRLTSAYYKYNVDVVAQNGMEFEIEIDSRTGQAILEDVDRF